MEVFPETSHVQLKTILDNKLADSGVANNAEILAIICDELSKAEVASSVFLSLSPLPHSILSSFSLLLLF